MLDIQYFFHHIQQFNKNKGYFVRHFYEQNSSHDRKECHAYASVLIHESATAPSQQARGHSTKGGCSSIEL